MLDNNLGNIYNEIILSRKYAHLYAPLIRRICAEEYAKYKRDKDRIKAVKNKLHMIYGAFLDGDCYKKADIIVGAAIGRPQTEYTDEQSSSLQSIYTDAQCAPLQATQIMRLHASTRERLDNLEQFYAFIFDIIGKPESVLDIGCGFNPFALAYMPAGIKKYYAYDIDYRIAELINKYFGLLDLPELAGCADIIAETPRDIADAAFIFKLMPVIEAQAPGRAFKLFSELNAGYIVVSYPVKSLCGRDKGMGINYARAFESGIGSGFKILACETIGCELVYIIKSA